MRRTLPLLLLGLMLLASNILYAQSETQPPDDMPFAFILGIVMLSVAVGAIIVGAVAATLILCLIFGLSSAGILSTAIIVGLYKQSVSAGFKTLLIVLSAISGIIAGITGLYLINHIFELNLSHAVIAWSGLGGGLAGGILLALSIIGIIRVMILYFKKRLVA